MLDLPYGAQAFSGCGAWASLALASGPRCPAACGILVPWPGIEPAPSAMAVRSLNHWTAREVLEVKFLIHSIW